MIQILNICVLLIVSSAAQQPTVISESALLPLPSTSGEPKPPPPTAGNELAIQIRRESSCMLVANDEHRYSC